MSESSITSYITHALHLNLQVKKFMTNTKSIRINQLCFLDGQPPSLPSVMWPKQYTASAENLMMMMTTMMMMSLMVLQKGFLIILGVPGGDKCTVQSTEVHLRNLMM